MSEKQKSADWIDRFRPLEPTSAMARAGIGLPPLAPTPPVTTPFRGLFGNLMKPQVDGGSMWAIGSPPLTNALPPPVNNAFNGLLGNLTTPSFGDSLMRELEKQEEERNKELEAQREQKRLKDSEDRELALSAFADLASFKLDKLAEYLRNANSNELHWIVRQELVDLIEGTSSRGPYQLFLGKRKGETKRTRAPANQAIFDERLSTAKKAYTEAGGYNYGMSGLAIEAACAATGLGRSVINALYLTKEVKAEIRRQQRTNQQRIQAAEVARRTVTRR
jgi:hypothetical protein